ncbi:MAG: hypothetical protein K9K38_03945 [Rhodoferax sp.]|nr:hypothetical protein [Rhodoferax sp.]
MLTSFAATSNQNDQRVAIIGEVDPIAWTRVDDVFTQAIAPLCSAED